MHKWFWSKQRFEARCLPKIEILNLLCFFFTPFFTRLLLPTLFMRDRTVVMSKSLDRFGHQLPLIIPLFMSWKFLPCQFQCRSSMTEAFYLFLLYVVIKDQAFSHIMTIVQFYSDDGRFIVWPKARSFITPYNKNKQNSSVIELLH